MSEAHPIGALKAALRASLLADDAINTALGGAIHDAPPRGSEPPYLILGDALSRENATSEADGRIIDLDLAIITKERGTRAGLALAAMVEAYISSVTIIPEGYHLVALIHRETITRQDVAKSLTRVGLRLRAFIEPL